MGIFMFTLSMIVWDYIFLDQPTATTFTLFMIGLIAYIVHPEDYIKTFFMKHEKEMIDKIVKKQKKLEAKTEVLQKQITGLKDDDGKDDCCSKVSRFCKRVKFILK